MAITNANAHPGDTINFHLGHTGVITLQSALLAITANVSISGPGAANLAIGGTHAYQVFFVNGATVTISGVTIEYGSGGGINIHGGTVTVTNSTLSGNSVGSGGLGGGSPTLAAGLVTAQDLRIDRSQLQNLPTAACRRTPCRAHAAPQSNRTRRHSPVVRR
jgi:hypothetical protein